MVTTLADVLRERAERAAASWSMTEQMLVAIYERIGMTAWLAQQGKVWRDRPEPLKRPWEADKPKGMRPASFIKLMAGGAKAA